MSKSKRIQNFITGLLIIAAGIVLVLAPKNGYQIVTAAFGIVFVVIGIRNLYYYFSLARYMNSGLMALLWGFVFTDLGLFALSILHMEKDHVFLFLLFGFMVAGIVDVLSAIRLKKISSPVWLVDLIQGLICVVLPILTVLLFSNSVNAEYIYAAVIVYRGLGTMLSAFRRTAIVYVSE